MSSTSETGHAKNVANFEDLISFCIGYAATYNPSNETLKVANLQTQLVDAQALIKQSNTTETAFDKATNKRTIAFRPLKPLATRIINSLDATEASAETVKDARTINRKLQGQRAIPKSTPKSTTTSQQSSPLPAPLGELEGASDKTISVSQQSFDQQIEHFAKLIALLEGDSNYTPNETDLNISGIQAKLSDLRATNTDVINAYTNWSNTRIARGNALYNPLTGLVNTALNIKKYIRSIFGTDQRYKQVSGLQFKTRND